MRRPNLSFLKNLCLVVCIGLLIHGRGLGQSNLATKSFDTVLSNSGFAIYNIPIPQFDPDSGQLVSVKLSASVTSTYGFSLTNINSNPATYQLNIGQEDQFTISGLSPFLNITPQYVGTYTLQPGQSESAPPFPFMTNNVSTDSITASVAPFLGNGTIKVSYMSFAYTNLWAFDHSAYTFSNAITSTTQLSVQYLYTTNSVILAASLTRWTAQLTAPGTVQLDWSAVNETAGRSYDVQRSADAHNFMTVATLPGTTIGGATTDYSYTDQLPPGISGKVYYRLQIHDERQQSWSPVREVNLDATATALHIYPNPATDHIDIATGTENDDWQVEILSTAGAIVQRTSFRQAALLHVPFTTRLPAGTYFARVTALHGQKPMTAGFIVTGGF